MFSIGDFIVSVVDKWSKYFGRIQWLCKKYVSFTKIMAAALVGVALFLWRLIWGGICGLVSMVTSLGEAVGDLGNNKNAIADLLDFGNSLIALEEIFALFALFCAYAVLCLTVRFIRAFIPTCT